MAVRSKCFLAESQRLELEAWSQASGRKPREVRRAQLLLLLDSGLSVRKAAAAVNIRTRLVKFWKDRWEEERFDGLKDKSRSGRKVRLTEEQDSEIREMIERGSKLPSLTVFAQKFNVSRMTVSRLIRRLRGDMAGGVLIKSQPIFAPLPQPLVSVGNGPNEGAPVDLVKMMNDACELHHKHRQHAEAERKFREIIAVARKESDWHPAALRAELNMMYMPYGQGDLQTAERRAHEIREKAKQEEKRIIVAETTLFLARICERRQCYDKVDNWLDESQRELSTLYPNGVPPIPMPNTTADIGHSLVIPSEDEVPAAFFQAVVHHFRGKNQIQRGVIEGNEGEVSEGIRNLEKAFAIDLAIKADSSIKWDLLWQVEGRTWVPRNRSGCWSGIDNKTAVDCLAMFQRQTGAGAGYHYLFQAFLDDWNGRTRKFEDYRQQGIEIFTNLPLWSGVAAIYHNDSRLSFLLNEKEDLTRRLEAAFAAASLEPFTYYLDNLKRFWSEWLGSNKPAKPENYVRNLKERILGYDGDFSDIQSLIKHGGQLGILEMGMQEAADTLQWVH